jgi:hypothetical protein
LINVRAELEVGGHHLVPGDNFPGMDGGAAHDVSQVGQGGAFGLVVRLVIADSVEQVRPLRLPGGDRLLRCAPGDVVRGAALVLVSVDRAQMVRTRELGRALGAVDEGGEVLDLK